MLEKRSGVVKLGSSLAGAVEAFDDRGIVGETRRIDGVSAACAVPEIACVYPRERRIDRPTFRIAAPFLGKGHGLNLHRRRSRQNLELFRRKMVPEEDSNLAA